MLNRLIAWWWGFEKVDPGWYARTTTNVCLDVCFTKRGWGWAVVVIPYRMISKGMSPSLWSAMRAARKAAAK